MDKKEEFFKKIGADEKTATIFFQKSLKQPAHSGCDFNNYTGSLEKLNQYYQDKYQKKINIKTNLWYPNTSNFICKPIVETIWLHYFEKNKPTTELLESVPNGIGMTIPNRPLDLAMTSSISFYLSYERVYSTNHNSLFQSDGIVRTFAPTNINSIIGVEFNKTQKILPIYYQGPYQTFSNDDIEIIKELAKIGTRTKIELIRGKVTKDGYCNLALVIKRMGSLDIYTLGPAGLYFIEDIIQTTAGILEEDYQEWLSQEELRQIAQRLIPIKMNDLAYIKEQMRVAKLDLIDKTRKFFTLERELKGQDSVQIVQKAFEDIRREARKEKLIKLITLDPRGKFRVLLGNLSISFYHDKNGDQIESSSSLMSQGYTKEEVEFGYVDLVLEDNYLTSVFNGNTPLHPHIFTENGEMCLGSGGGLIAELIGRLQIVGAIKIYLSLLQKYNPSSPVHTFYSALEYQQALADIGITKATIEEFENTLISVDPKQLANNNILIYQSPEIENKTIEKPTIRRKKGENNETNI